MPYPSISFRTELDPVVRKELDALSVQHEEYLSKEHKPDGTHGDLTADSAVIAGDLTVDGSVGFEDLSGNTINCVTLHVDGETTMDGSLTAATGYFGGNHVQLGDTGLTGIITLTGSDKGTTRDGGAPQGGSLNLSNNSQTNNTWSELSFGGADANGIGREAARYGVQYTAHAAGTVTADHVWKGEADAELMRLKSDGTLGVTNNVNVASTKAYYWTSRAVLTSPADGVIQGTTNSAAAGARLNFTNNNQIVFQNLAGSDRADIFAKAAGFSSVVNLKAYTVATLPAGTRGDIAYVTDALAPAFLTVVAGGGAVVAPVFYDGTNWVGF